MYCCFKNQSSTVMCVDDDSSLAGHLKKWTFNDNFSNMANLNDIFDSGGVHACG
jgi:hypothetical protein